MNTLVCFGMGYCSKVLAQRLTKGGGWKIVGTSRSQVGAQRLADQGFEGLVFDGHACVPALAGAVAKASHILLAAPPDAEGDPVLRVLRKEIARAEHLDWIGYLSTIGVYGDSRGGWVDEDTPTNPTHERTIRRRIAEDAWLTFGVQTAKAVQIFRIAGIYGPGRNVLEDLLAGSARRLIKPGQVFNRIHVEDISQSLAAAMSRGRPGRIYNLTDDEPASVDDVLLRAASLLGVEAPTAVPFDAASVSSMLASFYADNRRVRNQRIKSELKVVLRFPTYREGLAQLLDDLNARTK